MSQPEYELQRCSLHAHVIRVLIHDLQNLPEIRQLQMFILTNQSQEMNQWFSAQIQIKEDSPTGTKLKLFLHRFPNGSCLVCSCL